MSVVRLAYGGPDRALAKGLGEVTDVRLSGANQDGTDGGQAYQRRAFGVSDVRLTEVLEAKSEGTDVRLAGSDAGHGGLEPQPVAPGPYLDRRPALLVSYAYWKQFSKFRHEYHFRDFALDSGAYTVANSGGTIDLQTYIGFCRGLMASDRQCAEIYALDVLTPTDHALSPEQLAKDAAASARNTALMWEAGVPAIPCYHTGEPPEFLTEMASHYPKVALGGLVGMGVKAKRKWVEQCFARVYPKRIHGFGVMAKEILFAVPFDSVDASNWEMGPAAFGNWRSLGNVKGLRGGRINLRMEVEHYLKLERDLKQRWARELAKLPPVPPLHACQAEAPA